MQREQRGAVARAHRLLRRLRVLLSGFAGLMALAGLALVGSAAVAAEALQPQPQPPPVKAVQVAERVWFVQGEAALGSPENGNFISNAGFIVTDDGVVVVDALGSPALAQALLAEIRRVTPQPVRWVIVTHYHADHIYGLQVFKEAGAQLLAHRKGLDYLNSDTAAKRLADSRLTLAPWVDETTRLVPADRWLATSPPCCAWVGWTWCCARWGRPTPTKTWWCSRRRWA